MIIKKTTLTLIILISIKTYSQKCKTDKDPFTNEQITSFDFDNKTVYFEIKNDSIKFETKFNYWGERKYEFDKGAEILLKLENGSKMNLKTIKQSKPIIEIVTSTSIGSLFPGYNSSFGTTSSENFTAYSFTFLLTKAELKNLIDSKIDIIRIPDTDESEYVDLKAIGKTKKKIRAIKKGATCISENI